jgi:hypothetical protein
MRQSLFCSIIYSFCLLCSSYAFAGSNRYYQGPQKDSVPSRIISSASITVRDLADGNTIDSVLVTVGVKKGYTDINGFVQFDSVSKESFVT